MLLSRLNAPKIGGDITSTCGPTVRSWEHTENKGSGSDFFQKRSWEHTETTALTKYHKNNKKA
jgi:hypothetical protein